MPKFRDGRTGFLKIQHFNGMELLPFDQSKCSGPGKCTATFVAGDSRVNLFLGLTSYHLLFTREHHRIATRLQKNQPALEWGQVIPSAYKEWRSSLF